MKHRILLVALIVFSLVAVGTWLSAQVVIPQKVAPPVVLSGSDVGFRVEAHRGETVIGRLVVRVNGQWVEADLAGGPVRVSP